MHAVYFPRKLFIPHTIQLPGLFKGLNKLKLSRLTFFFQETYQFRDFFYFCPPFQNKKLTGALLTLLIWISCKKNVSRDQFRSFQKFRFCSPNPNPRTNGPGPGSFLFLVI